MDREQERKYAQKMRETYAPKSAQESKFERLRQLDRAARRPANVFTWTFGIIGTLVLGVGMCLAMEVIGDLMPVGVAVGVAVGVVGIAMVVANYFIYRAILKSRRKKYADKVLSVSDELLHEE